MFETGVKVTDTSSGGNVDGFPVPTTTGRMVDTARIGILKSLYLRQENIVELNQQGSSNLQVNPDGIKKVPRNSVVKPAPFTMLQMRAGLTCIGLYNTSAL